MPDTISDIASRLERKLAAGVALRTRPDRYYEGEVRLASIGLALPPKTRRPSTVVNRPSVAARVAQAGQDEQDQAVLGSVYGPQALRVDIDGGALDGITDASGGVERIGAPAVRTYQELVRHGHRYTDADVTRTRRRVDQAHAIIGD